MKHTFARYKYALAIALILLTAISCGFLSSADKTANFQVDSSLSTGASQLISNKKTPGDSNKFLYSPGKYDVKSAACCDGLACPVECDATAGTLCCTLMKSDMDDMHPDGRTGECNQGTPSSCCNYC